MQRVNKSISVTADLMSNKKKKSCDIPTQHITKQEHLIATIKTQEVLFWRQRNDQGHAWVTDFYAYVLLLCFLSAL